MVLSEKLSKRALDNEHRIFIANATYLEMNCYIGNLPLTNQIRLDIIDRMEELECYSLLQQFLIDLREN